MTFTKELLLRMLSMSNKNKKFRKSNFTLNRQTSSTKLQYYSIPFIYLSLIILIVSSQCNAYNITKCKYGSETYALEWAFEPLTQHVVFVLTAMIPSNIKANQTLFSGVGFGNHKNVSIM